MGNTTETSRDANRLADEPRVGGKASKMTLEITTRSGMRKFNVVRDEVKVSDKKTVTIFHLKGTKGADYALFPFSNRTDLFYCLKTTVRVANPFPSRSWKLEEDGTLKEVLL